MDCTALLPNKAPGCGSTKIYKSGGTKVIIFDYSSELSGIQTGSLLLLLLLNHILVFSYLLTCAYLLLDYELLYY